MGEVTTADPDRSCAAILALLQESFARMDGRIDPPSSLTRMTEADVARQAQKGNVLMIAEGDDPIACVFITPKEGHLYLGKLAVSPSRQGEGHARRLVMRAEEIARHQAMTYLELETRIELVENHLAFKRLGFEKVGETSHAGYDRPTSITMRKAVSRRDEDLLK